jgi:hypothetical protein
MFRIEIEQDDELIDLVTLMARKIGAAFGSRMVLETEDERLARSVAALTGSRVEKDPRIVRPAMGVEPADGAIGMLRMEQAASVSAETVNIPKRDNGTAQISQNGNGHRTNAKSNGKCKYCNDPIGPKKVVCGKRECKRMQSREWQARYEAKKAGTPIAPAASQAETTPAVEVAQESEAPFAQLPPEHSTTAPMYRVPTADGLQAMTHREMMQDIAAKRLAVGTRIQAQPSGRFYVVQEDGTLGKVPVEREAGPGPLAA